MVHKLTRKPPPTAEEREKPKPVIRIKNTGLAPEWKELPRRRCANCGKRFQPVRPEQRFCRDSIPGKPDHCRNQFKLHGGSYHKLLPIMQREIASQMAQTIRAVSELIERVNALESKRKAKSSRARRA